MLLGGILINRGIWEGGVCPSDLLRLPDEILQKVAFVLGKEEVFSLFDNCAG